MQRVHAALEGAPQKGSSTPAQTTIGATAAQAVGANKSRKALIVQNTGTTVIKLTFGTVSPTQTVYHVALKACSVADDGTGSTYIDEHWIGAVQAISSAASGTFVLTEITAAGAIPTWDSLSGA